MEMENCDRKARRDSKKKTISVIHGLDFDNIQVRFVASYDEWDSLEDTFLKKGGAIDAEDVTPFIKNGLKKISGKVLADQVRLYSKKDPEEFSWEFYYNFICVARSISPNIPAQRGSGGASGKNVKDIAQIKNDSRWIYAYLSYWLGQSDEIQPKEMKETLDRISPGWRKKKGATNMALSLALEIINKHPKENRSVDYRKDPEGFRVNWIYEPKKKPSPFKDIKGHLEAIGYKSTLHHLKDIFTLD
jgi:hypothetical protein